MIRLAAFLSMLAILSLACGALAAPTSMPTLVPENTAESPAQSVGELSALPNSALVDIYDPDRDPAEDLRQAVLIAQGQNKRIMLELGGDWCIWCKYLDEFYASHADILKLRADNYILVKVNVSETNMNEEFLAGFPEAAGYPHIYILESDGTFLHSQDTVELEDGGQSYVPEVVIDFLQRWAPPN
jgi:thiol:disulfide interchange protein